MVPLHMMPSDMRATTMTIHPAQLVRKPTPPHIRQFVHSPRLIRELNDIQERVQRQIEGKQ